MTQKIPPMIMPVFVKFWGPRASFNRPEFITERVSYLVPTPSAIRGMLESIYWKPEFHWRVREIWVLNPIRHFSETRNEVADKANRKAGVNMTDENRLQRHTLGLADVAYGIIAEPVPVPFSVEDMEKHVFIFNKRVVVGQAYQQPFFGVREYSAFYGRFDTATTKPIDVTMNLGRMAFDFNYGTPGMTYRSHNNNSKPIPVWFDAKLEKGVVHVPDDLYDISGGCRGHDRDQPPSPGI